MATQAQIDANRRNSQKSTGPRTAAGKTASSQNALRHGLYAESIVIDDESAPDFEILQREYFDDCAPEGARETALVLELVRCDWLTRRTTALETQLWNHAIDDRREWLAGDFDESTPLAHGYTQMSERLVFIQRRLTALSRAWHRAFHDLQRLQSARSKPSGPPPAPPEIGFVPKNDQGDRTAVTSAPSAPSAHPKREAAEPHIHQLGIACVPQRLGVSEVSPRSVPASPRLARFRAQSSEHDGPALRAALHPSGPPPVSN